MLTKSRRFRSTPRSNQAAGGASLAGIFTSATKARPEAAAVGGSIRVAREIAPGWSVWFRPVFPSNVFPGDMRRPQWPISNTEVTVRCAFLRSVTELQTVARLTANPTRTIAADLRQAVFRHGSTKSVRSLPMRPSGPTAKGSERAFQFLSASAGSPDDGFRGRQWRPSSVEMSVPFGPTVIQVFASAL